MLTLLTASATALATVTYAVFRTAGESIVASATWAALSAATVIVIAIN